MSTTCEAVQQAFDALLVSARAGAPLPTVAAVAARANISRSSMYRFHADVVARIQALSRSKRDARHEALSLKVSLLARRLKAERELTKALARARAELAAEKASLIEEFEDERLRLELRVQHLQKQIRGRQPLTMLHAGGKSEFAPHSPESAAARCEPEK